MKNKYCLSVAALNICLMFCVPLAGSSINENQQQAGISLLDSSWRYNDMEKKLKTLNKI